MSSNIIKLFIEFGEKKYSQVIKIANNFPFVIGRQAPDLTLKDPRISRRHCQLLVETGMLYIEDLGSIHGIEVNGAMVKRTRLRIDDHIKLGNTHIKVIQIDITTKKSAKSGKSNKGSGFF